MLIFAYTGQDILTALGYFLGIALVLALGTIVIVGGVSSLIIKRTTKLNWVASCLVGLTLGVGACKVLFTSHSRPEALTSIKVVQNKNEHPVLAVGVEQSFGAVAVTKSGKDRAVAATWTTSGPGLEIDSKGYARALKAGSYTVTAEHKGMKASLPVLVSDKTVVSIRILPEDAALKVGSFVAYKVLAQWSDSSETDVSLVANYQSSAEAMLSVKSSRTHAFANKPGDFVVTIGYLGASGLASVRVTPYE